MREQATPSGVFPHKDQCIATGKLIAAVLTELGAECPKPLVKSDRLGHIVAAIPGHPGAEAKVQILDPAGKVNGIVTAERKESTSVDRQNRPRRRGEVFASDDC